MKFGAHVFEPASSELERWVHKRCALRRSCKPEEYSYDGCVFAGPSPDTCDGHFYDDETVLEVVSGHFLWKPGEPECGFEGEAGGYVHWACALDFTGLGLVDS